MNEEVKEWIIKAYEDYITAKYLISLPEDEIITSAVCFHSQQFVEKIFKAFLVLHKVKFGRTHNLSLLKELCARKGGDKLDKRIKTKELRIPKVVYSAKH